MNGEKFTHPYIYARERATADKIANLANKAREGKFSLKPTIFGLKKRMVTNIQPYECEQSQIKYFERLIEEHKNNH